MTEYCYECGSEEYTQHKPSCASKAVFNAYITLRDNDLNYFTDEMISTLGFKMFIEQCERTQALNELTKLSEELGLYEE